MAPPPPSFLTKLKVQLKLAVARLRMIQQRDETASKAQRRAMAQLLEAGKIDSARIRVENIIRADILSELHEMLELYCELLLARAGLMEAAACDPGLEEAVQTIIYAAPKTEVKELAVVRALLAEKYGKDFTLAAMDNTASKVSDKVVRKLAVTPPREELVLGYLEAIARTYGVDWPRGKLARPDAASNVGPSPPPYRPNQNDDDDDDDTEDVHSKHGGGGGGGGGSRSETTAHKCDPVSSMHKLDRLHATPPRTPGGLGLPLVVTPPRMTTDNVHPKLTLNSVELKQPSGRTQGRGPGAESDLQDLERRFAALKKP